MTQKTTHKTILALTLRELWVSRGLTVDEVSAIMGELLSCDKIQLIDQGLYFPELKEMKDLCHALEASFGYALGYADAVITHLLHEGWQVELKLTPEDTDALLAALSATHNQPAQEYEIMSVRIDNAFIQILRGNN